jgi:predicted transcriptional regulator
MTNAQLILNHIRTAGSLSIREAMDEYSMSGGTVTGTVTVLRDLGYKIKTEMRKNPISGRRYARYTLNEGKKEVA